MTDKKLLIPVFAVMISLIAISIPDAKAAGVSFSSGDLFAGVGTGMIGHYSSSGVLLDTLDTTTASTEQTGMCFDKSGDLYSTNFESGTMSKFDNHGNLLVANWGGPFSTHPESCVLDKAGNVYVGEVDGANQILKFNQSGTLLASYSPNAESRGLDWIDLASDQCTMYYTSEGNGVHRFDVCTNTQLSDLTTGLSGPAYALRILNNTSDVLVASTGQLYRTNSTGAIVNTYALPSGETSFLFAMNVDPDSKTFWTAGYNTGNIYHIDIATGTVLGQFNAPPNTFSVAGLALFGEPTVGCAPNCPQPIHVDTVLSSTSISLGATFTDNATLSGATSDASGTITYNVYNSTDSCNGQILFTSTKSVVNAKATQSDPFKPTMAGTYNIQAVYSGDSKNLATSSECNSETITVTPVTTQPAITTHLSRSSLYLGGSIVDSATLSGVTPNAGGFVKYNFYWINGTQHLLVNSSKVAVTNSIVPNSSPFKPTKIGVYVVQAVYSGDKNNKGAASKPSSEIFLVRPNTIVITQLDDFAEGQGEAINDTAFVYNITPNAGGTVTYNFYMGNQCTGEPVFTDTQTVTNGKVPGSASFTPTQVGVYNAQAVYSGDSHNKGGASKCGTEQFIVTPENTITIPSHAFK